MLILAFTYALLRLQYPYASLAGVLAIVCFNLPRVAFQALGDIEWVESDIDLLAFAVSGTAGAFALERFARRKSPTRPGRRGSPALGRTGSSRAGTVCETRGLTWKGMMWMHTRGMLGFAARGMTGG